MREVTEPCEKKYYLTKDGLAKNSEEEAMRHEWEEFVADKVYGIFEKHSMKIRRNHTEKFGNHLLLYSTEEKALAAYERWDEKNFFIDIVYLNEENWKEEWEEWNAKRS